MKQNVLMLAGLLAFTSGAVFADDATDFSVQPFMTIEPAAGADTPVAAKSEAVSGKSVKAGRDAMNTDSAHHDKYHNDNYKG